MTGVKQATRRDRKYPCNKPYIDWKVREWVDELAYKQEHKAEYMRKDHWRRPQRELFSADQTYSVRYIDTKDWPTWVFRKVGALTGEE